MSEPEPSELPSNSLRARVRHIIFDSNDLPSRTFDLLLILTILISVIAVLLVSVESVRAQYGDFLMGLEWVLTLIFTVEYFTRLWAAKEPGRYATSFYGIIDLLAIVPTYLSLLLPGAEFLIVVRFLRFLRVFRILKLLEYMDGAQIILIALIKSRAKIVVFLVAILTIVTIMGALMYLVEGPKHGFTSIPRSIYWAIVTISTVGYGDISPQTPLGQSIACLIILLGYGIIAIPSGIVAAEITRTELKRFRQEVDTGGGAIAAADKTHLKAAGDSAEAVRNTNQAAQEGVPKLPPAFCPNCGVGDHLSDARFCRRCGRAFD